MSQSVEPSSFIKVDQFSHGIVPCGPGQVKVYIGKGVLSMGGRSSNRVQVQAPVSIGQVDGIGSVHTLANPYCPNLGCACHTDLEYHEVVTGPQLGTDVEDWEYENALALMGGTWE
jgi:hypothetical protein